MEFVGAKAALFCDARVLTYLRDDLPGLGWAGFWDLPGGGREAAESPEKCLQRRAGIVWAEWALNPPFTTGQVFQSHA